MQCGQPTLVDMQAKAGPGVRLILANGALEKSSCPPDRSSPSYQVTEGSDFHFLENAWGWRTALGSVVCFSDSSLGHSQGSGCGTPRGSLVRGLSASSPSLL